MIIYLNFQKPYQFDWEMRKAVESFFQEINWEINEKCVKSCILRRENLFGKPICDTSLAFRNRSRNLYFSGWNTSRIHPRCCCDTYSKVRAPDAVTGCHARCAVRTRNARALFRTAVCVAMHTDKRRWYSIQQPGIRTAHCGILGTGCCIDGCLTPETA